MKKELEEKLEKKLIANTPAEKRLKAYVIENISDVVAEEILKGDKNIGDCIGYVAAQIEKKYKSGNTAFVDDSEVFSLAIHYFEEGSIAKGADVGSKVKAVHSADAPYTKASEHNINQEEFDRLKQELKKYKDAEAKAKEKANATEKKKKETKAKTQKVVAKEKDKGAVQMSLFDMGL